jgi:hypothetical protein
MGLGLLTFEPNLMLDSLGWRLDRQGIAWAAILAMAMGSMSVGGLGCRVPWRPYRG